MQLEMSRVRKNSRSKKLPKKQIIDVCKITGKCFKLVVAWLIVQDRNGRGTIADG